MTGAKLIATLVAVGIMVPLGAEYLAILRPSVRREGAAACAALQPSPKPKAFPTLPAPIKDFQGQDVTGKMVSLSAYRGQVVFLNFWATWCPPCQKEMPSMDELQRAVGDGFVVLAVASDISWQKVLDFFANGTAMTVLLDPPADGEEGGLGSIAESYGIPALPETFLIDKEGNVRYYFVNKRDWHSDVAITCIRSLLDE